MSAGKNPSMFDSIKLKLLAWFLAVFFVIFTLLGFFLYYELKEIVIGSLDNHASSEVTLLAGILSKEEEHGHLEEGIMELTSAATGEYAVALSGHYYQMVDANGIVLGRSPSLSLANKYLPITSMSEEPVFEVIIGPAGDPLRLVTQTFQYTGLRLTVQVADSLIDSYHLLYSFRTIILVAIPAIFLISISGVIYISGRSLRPLNAFSEKVGLITEKSLKERIDDTTPVKELRPLATSFNVMLSRLEKSFARQREFLSDASHELRTPTSVIRSQCDVTLRKERSEEEYRETITNIGKAAGRMTAIITRILDASRLESKIFHLKVEKIDLHELLDEAVRLLTPTATEHGLKISLNERKVVVMGDKERLSEVFVNLVDNAVKYSTKGGRIDINLSEEGKYAITSISDTGIGMTEKDKDMIFERFYRVDKSREEIPGSGLGLPIVKAVLDAHRGKIDVETEEGRGSTFKVYLLKH